MLEDEDAQKYRIVPLAVRLCESFLNLSIGLGCPLIVIWLHFYKLRVSYILHREQDRSCLRQKESLRPSRDLSCGGITVPQNVMS